MGHEGNVTRAIRRVYDHSVRRKNLAKLEAMLVSRDWPYFWRPPLRRARNQGTGGRISNVVESVAIDEDISMNIMGNDSAPPFGSRRFRLVANHPN